jgi:hypothetical protein
MTIARCLVDRSKCQWEVDFADGPAAADRGLERHKARCHPETMPTEPTEPVEPHVPQPLQQLANVDWWTQVMDGIAQLARESLRTGEPFTVFEVARFGVSEPINPQYDWGKATRDAVHLELIVHATDGEGRELSTRSPRPATKGSLVSLWRPGPAITGTPKTRSQSA